MCTTPLSFKSDSGLDVQSESQLPRWAFLCKVGSKSKGFRLPSTVATPRRTHGLDFHDVG